MKGNSPSFGNNNLNSFVIFFFFYQFCSLPYMLRNQKDNKNKIYSKLGLELDHIIIGEMNYSVFSGRRRYRSAPEARPCFPISGR